MDGNSEGSVVSACKGVEEIGLPALKICLPPADKKSLTGNIALPNYKISKLEQVLKPKVKTLCKINFLDSDGVSK